jgi:hypothetical protein
MSFMLIFGTLYTILVNTFGVDIAPMVVKLCTKILSIPGIETLLK